MQEEWRRQRYSVKVWAEAILEEAHTLLKGLESGFNGLGQRCLTKIQYMLHCYEVGTTERSFDDITLGPQWGQAAMSHKWSTCPRDVLQLANTSLAKELPVPSGWDQPGYAPCQCFGQWIYVMAYRLHDVYAHDKVPKKLSVQGLVSVTPMLLAMQLDLAAKLRAGIDRTCLLFEPCYEDTEDNVWDKLNEAHAPSHQPMTQDMLNKTKMISDAVKDALLSVSTPGTPNASSPGGSKPSSRKGSMTAGAQPPSAAAKMQSAAALSGAIGALGVQVKRARNSVAAGMAGDAQKNNRTQSRKSLSAGKVGDRKKSMATGLGGGKSKFSAREVGTDDIILTNLIADGAVWSMKTGLHVNRSIRGMTRLPALRVRAATPRAAECVLHQRFPHSHGCLELPVHRVLQSPWPGKGVVSGGVVTGEILQVRLPFVWGDTSRSWHPVSLFDALPPQLSDEFPALAPSSEGREGRGGGSSSTEGKMHMPLVLSRPFCMHPAAVPCLVADCSSSSVTQEPDDT